MTYTKTNWQTGDTITATKLNNIENQVAANEEAIAENAAAIAAASSGGEGVDIEFVTITKTDGGALVRDKTISEIKQAISDGKIVFARYTFPNEITVTAQVTTHNMGANAFFIKDAYTSNNVTSVVIGFFNMYYHNEGTDYYQCNLEATPVQSPSI